MTSGGLFYLLSGPKRVLGSQWEPSRYVHVFACKLESHPRGHQSEHQAPVHEKLTTDWWSSLHRVLRRTRQGVRCENMLSLRMPSCLTLAVISSSIWDTTWISWESKVTTHILHFSLTLIGVFDRLSMTSYSWWSIVFILTNYMQTKLHNEKISNYNIKSY